jgi:hypothetical protein
LTLAGWQQEVFVSIDAFISNLTELEDAITSLIEMKRVLPALALLYSGMDIVAGLERASDEGTQAAFVRWSDRYLLPSGPLPCNSLELYGARCGILHTYTPDSDLFRKGRVRRIVYAWGKAVPASLDEAATRLNRTDMISIHVEDLLKAFRAAIFAWFNEIIQDPDRLAQVEKHTGLWFSSLPIEFLNEFLAQVPPRPAV